MKAAVWSAILVLFRNRQNLIALYGTLGETNNIRARSLVWDGRPHLGLTQIGVLSAPNKSPQFLVGSVATCVLLLCLQGFEDLDRWKTGLVCSAPDRCFSREETWLLSVPAAESLFTSTASETPRWSNARRAKGAWTLQNSLFFGFQYVNPSPL